MYENILKCSIAKSSRASFNRENIKLVIGLCNKDADKLIWDGVLDDLHRAAHGKDQQERNVAGQRWIQEIYGIASEEIAQQNTPEWTFFCVFATGNNHSNHCYDFSN